MQSIQLYDIIKSRLRDHKSRKENADERILKLNSTEQQKKPTAEPEKLTAVDKAKTKGLYLSALF